MLIYHDNDEHENVIQSRLVPRLAQDNGPKTLACCYETKQLERIRWFLVSYYALHIAWFKLWLLLVWYLVIDDVLSRVDHVQAR